MVSEQMSNLETENKEILGPLWQPFEMCFVFGFEVRNEHYLRLVLGWNCVLLYL